LNNIVKFTYSLKPEHPHYEEKKKIMIDNNIPLEMLLEVSSYFDNPVLGHFDKTMSFLRFCLYDEDMEPLNKRLTKHAEERTNLDYYHIVQMLDKPLISIRNEKLMLEELQRILKDNLTKYPTTLA